MNMQPLQTKAVDPRLFADLSTDELLAMAVKTHRATPWHKYDRDMLLAFFHNRFGKFVPSAD